MESFFLAETTKYLYLLFDEANFIHNQEDSNFDALSGLPLQCVLGKLGYVFNTEAHPIDIGAVQCCRNYNRISKNFLDKQSAKNSNATIREDSNLTGKYRCNPRPFYQRLFTNGAFLEDKDDIFQ